MKILIEEGQKAEFKATLLENLIAKLVDNNLLASEKVCDGRLWYEMEDIIEDHLIKFEDLSHREHNDTTCNKYNEPVLPDENGKCSLCGATLKPEGVK